MTEPTQSNWGEYARLVLNELDRLNKAIDHHATDLTTIRSDLSLFRQDMEGRLRELERRVGRLDDDQNPKSLVSRMRKTEDSDLGELTIRKYRWGIVVFVVGILSSIIIPTIALVLAQGRG